MCFYGQASQRCSVARPLVLHSRLGSAEPELCVDVSERAKCTEASFLPSARPFRFLALQTATDTGFAFDLLFPAVETCECEAFARFISLGKAPCRIHLLAIDMCWDTIAAFVHVEYAFPWKILDAEILPLRLRAARRPTSVGRRLLVRRACIPVGRVIRARGIWTMHAICEIGCC